MPGKIGPQANDRLLKHLDEPDSTIAVAAAKSFEVMGSVGKQALPGLIAAAKLHADDEELCRSIGLAISEIDPHGAIPTLRQLLTSKDAGIRAFAAHAIADIGPPGRPCSKELLPLLSDPSTQVRIGAARALAQIDLPAGFPTAALEAATKDSNHSVRTWAAAALHRMKAPFP